MILPEGWDVVRRPDGSVALLTPPLPPEDLRRTSLLIYRSVYPDVHEILGRLADDLHPPNEVTP